jgi:hypothetical protein
MTAYSFQRRFVAPIQVGLGCYMPPLQTSPVPAPKRQTIRADRKHHVRPGGELQLYCGMRTKECFLIGRARCVSVEPIRFLIRHCDMILEPSNLVCTDWFAQKDGFADAKEMHEFWRKEHGLGVWRGVVIRWEPLKEERT